MALDSHPRGFWASFFRRLGIALNLDSNFTPEARRKMKARGQGLPESLPSDNISSYTAGPDVDHQHEGTLWSMRFIFDGATKDAMYFSNSDRSGLSRRLRGFFLDEQFQGTRWDKRDYDWTKSSSSKYPGFTVPWNINMPSAE